MKAALLASRSIILWVIRSIEQSAIKFACSSGHTFLKNRSKDFFCKVHIKLVVFAEKRLKNRRFYKQSDHWEKAANTPKFGIFKFCLNSKLMCASFGLKLQTITFLYYSPKTNYPKNIWLSSYQLKCSWYIRKQNSLGP